LEELEMLSLTRTGVAAGICAAVGLTALPASAVAVNITGNASVSVPSPTGKIHWEPYRHFHRWHPGWRYGLPRFGYGWSAGYPCYGYYSPCYGGYWGYNPVTGGFGTAAGLASFPLWGLRLALGGFTTPWWW
jgi:hypothetical protein